MASRIVSSNITARFKATGIWPVDETKYPKSRFDVQILIGYESWVKMGSPKKR